MGTHVLLDVAADNWLLSLIVWLIIGGLAGWLAGVLVRGAGFGVIGDMLVGIVGAVIGGLLLGALFGAGGGLLWSFFSAFVGAVILLLLVRLIVGNRTAGPTV